MPSNRKPPPYITVIGNPPDANRHEYHGGRYAHNSCKGKRHPDGMPSDKKIKIIQVSDVVYFYCPAEIKEIAEIIVTRPRGVLSALSAGLLVFHADSFYCPTEIKEIKEILLPSLGEAISAISALSAGHYYLVRIVFYCPADIKEIKEILFPSLCEALSAISTLSAGLLVSHAESFLSH